MNRFLPDWNRAFAEKISLISPDERHRAGVLLSVIPAQERWKEFLACVKKEWNDWKGTSSYPYCLLALYGGVAFYEYERKTFWEHFDEAIGAVNNNRAKLYQSFAEVVSAQNLRLIRRESGTDYVGSAVFHIGIPLSLWKVFLELCEWTLRNDDWESLNDAEWKLRIETRFPTQKRLRNFLLENRQAAAEFVRAVLEARRLLHAQPDLNFLELPQRKLLRDEYFDEVPETIDFLFPQNSKAREILFEDRPYLFWRDERARIEIHLPAVSRRKLADAVWRLDDKSEKASSTSNSMIINRSAFQADLSLTLETGGQIEKKTLRGLVPFGLHDGKRFINAERDSFPIDSYALISPEELEDFRWSGFDAEEYRPNEFYELEDGTRCFVTRLFPIGKTPNVSFVAQGKKFSLKFRRRSKIEAYFFAGDGSQAAQFYRPANQEIIKTERLPLVCVALPKEENNQAFLQKHFQVRLDEDEKLRACGRWEKRREDDIREYYVWNWNENRAVEKNYSTQVFRRSDAANPFAMLKTIRENYVPPDLTGKHKISLCADRLGMSFCREIEIIKPQPQIEKCWRDLPGEFLPFFLLCQKSEGMSWDEILLAKDVIAPDAPDFSEWQLRRYAKFGYLRQNGKLWQIADARASLCAANGICRIQFVGNPSLLWNLYFEIARKHPRLLEEKKIIKPGKPTLYALPPIKVETNGKFSFLQMDWRDDEKYKFLKNDIRAIFNRMGVKITPAF